MRKKHGIFSYISLNFKTGKSQVCLCYLFWFPNCLVSTKKIFFFGILESTEILHTHTKKDLRICIQVKVNFDFMLTLMKHRWISNKDKQSYWRKDGQEKSQTTEIAWAVIMLLDTVSLDAYQHTQPWVNLTGLHRAQKNKDSNKARERFSKLPQFLTSAVHYKQTQTHRYAAQIRDKMIGSVHWIRQGKNSHPPT